MTNRFQSGDVVECIVSWYKGINAGERRTVIGVQYNGNIVLHNPVSPTIDRRSEYSPKNFRLVCRPVAPVCSVERGEFHGGPMGHYAVVHYAPVHSPMLIEAATEKSLFEAVRDRVKANPEESWQLSNGVFMAGYRYAVRTHQ